MNPDLFRFRLVPVVSLAGAAAAVVVMTLWGMNALTAPLSPQPASATTTTGGSRCPTDQTVVKNFLTRGEVTVSVYNTGGRQGRAGITLAQLEAAGFQPGEVGNAPTGIHVARAQVRTTKRSDPAAELVARTLGAGTAVVVTTTTYGPGVDVFIGDRFNRIDGKAPARIKLARPVVSCG
jgi:hypothetical protein